MNTQVEAPARIENLFERCAQETPLRVAVRFRDQAVTYRELNDRANRIATAIQDTGISAGALVGIYVPRSIDLISAILGALKAGTFFVPIDTNNPPARTGSILRSSGLKHIITTPEFASLFSAYICIDLAAAQQSEPRPIIKHSKEAASYVIFTSGSTGQPKGVVIEHSAVLALMEWAGKAYSSAELSAVLAATSIGFDLSIFEIFAPLSHGGSVVIVDGILDFADARPQPQVTLINTVPSAAKELLRLKAIPESVITVNLAGEALRQDLVDDLYATGHITSVYNLYGPSEDTTYTTCYRAKPGEASTMVFIGWPIAGSRVFILDDVLNPVPIGVKGELCIAGAGLARGYLNQPQLTEEKFVYHSLNGESPVRLYKTGDLARMKRDGAIEFLGRKDHQVKIRGHRIEPGEITATLEQHPDIAESAVKAVQNPSGELELVAYFVGSQYPPSAEEMRLFLRRRLPAAMIPTHFVQLQSMPRNANGKIDLAALPLPVSGNGHAPQARALTATEEMLLQMWQDLLGRREISLDDNFFTLGGHSLLATRLVSRLRGFAGEACKLSLVFEHPTLRECAAAIDTLRKSESERGQPPAPAAGQLQHSDHHLPLSSPQKRLWLLEQMEPGQPISNIPAALRLKGALDIAALKNSLQALVDRHAILRTTYHSVAGAPVQVVHPQLSPRFHEFDLSGLPQEEREKQLHQLATTEANEPFNISNDCMLRAALVRLGAGDHALILTMHHLASDGWSIGIATSEVTRLYEAFKHGKPNPLPALLYQYSDFTRHHFSLLNGDHLERLQSYWVTRLEGANLSPLKLNVPKQMVPVRTYRGEQIAFKFEPALQQRVQQMSRDHGTTLFMTMLAGFYWLLHHYTGRSDLCIGTPVANRCLPEAEILIGFFVNTLVLRTEVRKHQTFSQFLNLVRRNTLEDLSHQDFPFENLLDCVPHQRVLSETPLFQVLFAFEPDAIERVSLQGLTVEALKFERNISKYDLSLIIQESGQHLSGIIEYSTELYSRPVMERLIGHYVHLLGDVTAHPERTVGTVEFLTPEEQHLLRHGWNNTSAPYLDHPSVPAAFKSIAHKCQDSPAIVADECVLTYGELDQLSDRMAAQLLSVGVRRGMPVGVCARRTPELVTAFLAILKAGGSYVPLDSSYPAERISFMLQDSGAFIIIGHNELLERLPAGRAISLSFEALADITLHETYGFASSCPDDAAYIVYTSGSSGQPKGVVATHRGILRLTQNMNYVTVGLQDVVLHLSSASFDATTFEIWGPLLNGACIALAPDGVPGLDALQRVIQTHGVSTVFITTQLFNTIVANRPRTLASVKQILFGGEVASQDHVNLFLDSGYVGALSNIYGPTECTTYAASFPILQKLSSGELIPIGKPVSNTSIHILNDDLSLVPTGVAGEIYIGGPGVARGYLNQPSLTAEKFLPDPFSGVAGERIYRTGDIGCYRPDGAVEFLGRIDRQVKRRGFRIELEEIESAMRTHPDVQQAIVQFEHSTAEPRLVCCVLPFASRAIDAGNLKIYAGSVLPEYMKPDAFVVLESLPLSVNGKIDASRLPSASGPFHGNSSGPMPTTELELLVAGIWKETLEVDSISLEDSFFELGGHSLKLIEALGKLQEEKAIMARRPALSIVDLFKYPTISSLVEFLEGAGETDSQSDASGRAELRKRRMESRMHQAGVERGVSFQ